MKKLLLAAAAVAATAVAAPAFAQAHGSVSYSSISVDDFDLSAITGRFGWDQGMLGIEGEASVGLDDDTIGAVTVELEHEFGVFGRLRGEVSENLELFARAGYVTTSIDVNGVSIDESGFAFGAGANWFFDGLNGVRGEYTQYDVGNGTEADVWSIGFVRRFR